MEAADGHLLPGAQDGDETLPVDLPACDICDKTFKTNSEVRKHRKIHFDGKFQCSHCGKKFKTVGNRNVHERQVHGAAKYNCKFCEKIYKTKNTLEAHIKKKHAAEEDIQERQPEVDPDLTLEALEGGEGMEPGEVQEMTVNVVHSDQMNNCGGVVIQSSECAVLQKEGEVLVQPDMEAETQSSTDTSEHFNTVYKSCFQRDRDSFSNDTENNNNKCSIKVRIGDEELVIIGKEQLVLTVGTVIHDYFYPEEEEDDLVEAAPSVRKHCRTAHSRDTAGVRECHMSRMRRGRRKLGQAEVASGSTAPADPLAVLLM